MIDNLDIPERNEAQNIEYTLHKIIVRLEALEANNDFTEARKSINKLLELHKSSPNKQAPVESEPVVDKSWPQVNDKYYFLEAEGVIIDTEWNNDSSDIRRLARGAVFRTKEEAEKTDQLRLAMNELKVMSEKSCALHPDRDPCVGLLWNSFTKEWEALIYSQCTPLGGILFLKKQDALEAIEIVDPKYKGVL